MNPDDGFAARYGPWAVVAGASEGLGAAFAAALAARGLSLVLAARRAEKLDDVAAKLRDAHGIEARCVTLDLADSGAVAALDRETRDLDTGLVVYNAALSLIGSFLDEPLDRHLDELAINCRGPLSAAHTFGTRLRERGRGGIVLMSSLSGLQGSPLISHYAATKAYNLVLGEGLWEEYRRYGVDVLACVAGATLTPNYAESAPREMSALAPAPMTAESVVAEALSALGRRPSLIPGRGNRMATFLMSRILPRKSAVLTMADNMRRMYPAPDQK